MTYGMYSLSYTVLVMKYLQCKNLHIEDFYCFKFIKISILKGKYYRIIIYILLGDRDFCPSKCQVPFYEIYNCGSKQVRNKQS